jgi:hypothetical protein
MTTTTVHKHSIPKFSSLNLHVSEQALALIKRCRLTLKSATQRNIRPTFLCFKTKFWAYTTHISSARFTTMTNIKPLTQACRKIPMASLTSVPRNQSRVSTAAKFRRVPTTRSSMCLNFLQKNSVVLIARNSHKTTRLEALAKPNSPATTRGTIMFRPSSSTLIYLMSSQSQSTCSDQGC